MLSSDIQIRDPFIVPVAEEGMYYLYGTTDPDCWTTAPGSGIGFNAYRSRDLQQWEGPYPVFRPEPGFWADHNFWAPEMHQYQGKCYLCASFKAEGHCRGTQILRSDSGPLGPFVPHSDGPVTPRDWECLDGTLYVDDAGSPWMVFCHEWVQIGDGTMCAMPLTADLARPAGEPQLLFHASAARWAKPIGEENTGYVTDGPFLFRTREGRLLILWSTCGWDGYAMGIAHSTTGSILGPWQQEEHALYGKDGGHGMLFRAFSGELYMTLHTPNHTPMERPVFIPVREADGTIRR